MARRKVDTIKEIVLYARFIVTSLRFAMSFRLHHG
jgi:hypothetical protein